MYEIWIATSNKNKVREFKEMFEGINIIVKSLLDLTVPVPEIPETGTTFEENAFLKADYLSKMLNKPVLADDSGLEIIGLGNFPGVNTRRWIEPITDNNIINNLLIEKCRSLEERDAQAVCVLCYINPSTNETRYFRGITKGLITEKPVGNNVFGYDAIFFLPEISQTYAELTVGEKNKYSHRSKAFQMFKKWWLGGKYEDNKKINIILFEPEIAQNVGAIMRTCVAINAKLHLIEPFGFIFDERFIARSSANYVEFADYETYNDWNHFSQLNPIIKLYCATRYAQQPHSSINFTKEEKIFILFGRESTGIPTTILKEHLSRTFRIPMSEKVRSLNVANTVGIVGYEIMRQWDYPGLSKVETQKGADFLKQK